MFGYLQIGKNSPKEYKAYYKYAYCSLCKAIQKDYGNLARLFLSYDVTLLSLLIKESTYYGKFSKIHCIRGKTNSQSDDDFSLLSAINILLVREKIIDNIRDTGGAKYKIALRALNPMFKKASKRYTNLSNELSEMFIRFRECEKNKTDIYFLSKTFGEMMKKIGKVFHLEEKKLFKLELLGRWVYLIDAIDDYKRDIKKKEFNPLIEMFDCKPLFYKKNELLKMYHVLYLDNLEKENTNELSDSIVNYIMEVSIPNTTVKIIQEAIYG